MQVHTETEEQTTIFRDELYFHNGLFTIPTYFGVYLFFVYRHLRIKQLIKKGMLV
ncbi:hypothetical protein FHS15_000395 [Paenibacillus castaneae]|nr:hypothetical protein [Paenibacillus castaneae]